jgi:hypothetical protein
MLYTFPNMNSTVYQFNLKNTVRSSKTDLKIQRSLNTKSEARYLSQVCYVLKFINRNKISLLVIILKKIEQKLF